MAYRRKMHRPLATDPAPEPPAGWLPDGRRETGGLGSGALCSASKNAGHLAASSLTRLEVGRAVIELSGTSATRTQIPTAGRCVVRLRM